MDSSLNQYCLDLFNRKRYVTREITVGKIKMGGNQPIRIQSMTTADTMDTQKSIDESIRMIDAGCELVRLTAPSIKEAKNLGVIKTKLNELGYDAPLVADIHFTPNAAEVAAQLIEKVRVNPGNYADKKKFEEFDFTDEGYQAELVRIEKKFRPLVEICKANNTAMRIGTNHGSLSDRILSRFGDTPKGMVESAMEFLRICKQMDFNELVISMKASNTLVMVQAYRLLVNTMEKEGMNYPLHLGVTEAGDGEDGRIKSAVGIGALLEDGLGDTIRVSLTEDPEFEIPVARKLIEKFSSTNNIIDIETNLLIQYNPFEHERRETNQNNNIGGKSVPVVFADLSNKKEVQPINFYGFGYNYSIPLDKWTMQDLAADYVFLGDTDLNFEIPGTLGAVFNYDKWNADYRAKKHTFPYLKSSELSTKKDLPNTYFLEVQAEELNIELIKAHSNAVLVINSAYSNKTQLYRYARTILDHEGIKNPVILKYNSTEKDLETVQLHVSSDAGNQFLDGFGDGIWISSALPTVEVNSMSFGILQATRTRISKTEYISCPSCGRTLFDLQETTAKIRSKTSHLKGLKIGIMGCIVNGPGEMADADYGYVGTGIGKIHLYKEKTIVRKNVPEAEAVDALIELIKENNDWVDPV